MSNTPRSLSPRGHSQSRTTSPRPPPSNSSTGYLDAAPTTTGTVAQATRTRTSPARSTPDPFLQQSQDIRLTERDRQEGYDVDLLNAKPRTSNKHQQPQHQHHHLQQHGLPLAAGTAAGLNSSYASGLGGAAVAPGRTTVDGTTTSNPDSNATASHNEKHALFGHESGTRYGSQRPWYMRKLAVLGIVLIVAAAALAIGLGVGLSERKHDRKSDAVQAGGSGASSGGDNGSSSAAGGEDDESRTGTRNATATYNMSSRSRGTVIPSSLYSQYTDTVSDVTATPSSSGPEAAAPTPSPTLSPIVTGSQSNTFEGTTRATTGNLPIPADSATTVGTVVFSSISALGGLQRRTPTEPTARLVMARRRRRSNRA
ncbi:hypothetical protein ACM66B_007042 [Microbotryomycetes sp. NB124-2]